MLTDHQIIHKVKDQIGQPVLGFVTVYKLFRGMSDPRGTFIRNFQGEKDMKLNYQAFRFSNGDIFCVIGVQTLFSTN